MAYDLSYPRPVEVDLEADLAKTKDYHETVRNFAAAQCAHGFEPWLAVVEGSEDLALAQWELSKTCPGYPEGETLLGQGGYASVYIAYDDSTPMAVRRVTLSIPAATTGPEAQKFLASFAQQITPSLRAGRADCMFAVFGSNHRIVLETNKIQILSLMSYLGTTSVASETARRIMGMNARLDAGTQACLLPVYSPQETMNLLTSVIMSVATMHARGLVHGDLKAPNIMVQPGTPLSYIIDAGCSDDVASTQGIKGTIIYMPPELLQDSKHPRGFAEDMWAVGMLALQLLSCNAATEGFFYCATPTEVELLVHGGKLGNRQPTYEELCEMMLQLIERYFEQMGEAMLFPAYVDHQAYGRVIRLAQLCLQRDPAKRPSVMDLCALGLADREVLELAQQWLLQAAGEDDFQLPVVQAMMDCLPDSEQPVMSSADETSMGSFSSHSQQCEEVAAENTCVEVAGQDTEVPEASFSPCATAKSAGSSSLPAAGSPTGPLTPQLSGTFSPLAAYSCIDFNSFAKVAEPCSPLQDVLASSEADNIPSPTLLSAAEPQTCGMVPQVSTNAVPVAASAEGNDSQPAAGSPTAGARRQLFTEANEQINEIAAQLPAVATAQPAVPMELTLQPAMPVEASKPPNWSLWKAARVVGAVAAGSAAGAIAGCVGGAVYGAASSAYTSYKQGHSLTAMGKAAVQSSVCSGLQGVWLGGWTGAHMVAGYYKDG